MLTAAPHQAHSLADIDFFGSIPFRNVSSRRSYKGIFERTDNAIGYLSNFYLQMLLRHSVAPMSASYCLKVVDDTV